jgi:hypothetical protein
MGCYLPGASSIGVSLSIPNILKRQRKSYSLYQVDTIKGILKIGKKRKGDRIIRETVSKATTDAVSYACTSPTHPQPESAEI